MVRISFVPRRPKIPRNRAMGLVSLYKEALLAENRNRVDRTHRRRLEKKLNRAQQTYRRELWNLRTRMSKKAFRYFWLGFGRWATHDATLLSFCAGDALGFRPDGKKVFRLNRRVPTARLELLNRFQNLVYRFSYRHIRRVLFDHPSEQPLFWGLHGAFDDHYCDLLTDAGGGFLSHSCIFCSGLIIQVEFRKLVFHRRRVKRSFDLSAIYG